MVTPSPPQPGRAAIYFHPEAFTTASDKPMGRNSAGESFLKSFLQFSKAEKFWVQVTSSDHAKAFESAVRAMNRTEPVQAFGSARLGQLREPGCLFLPGPNLSDSAWQRSFFGHSQWSLCGITHTTASTNAMDAIIGLIAGPIQPWDALICTTPTVKNNVELIMQGQVNYLQERLNIQRLVLPQLPVIPLGIHCKDFTFTATEKAKARKQLGIGKDTLVVLFAGRLSFHAKAHPLAMYQALDQAIASSPKFKNVLLLELGWHANEPIAKAFSDAAQWAAPQLKTLHLDSRDPDLRRMGWAAGDIFCSLSDNLQEAFGITPIEAMAAGLPTVVSDWDGYRFTVEDGVTGYRVPTSMPGSGQGQDLAMRHALGIDTYDMYSGFTSSLVGIDIDATAEAFRRLFASAELRKTMGESGRKRALERFDWSVVIQEYENLWQSLSDIRKAAANSSPSVWPARQDPFQIFASYPTTALGPESLLQARYENPDHGLERLGSCLRLAMVAFAKGVMPSEDELRQLLQAAGPEAKPAESLVAALPQDRQLLAYRGLAWLLKLGFLRLLSRSPSNGR